MDMKAKMYKFVAPRRQRSKRSVDQDEDAYTVPMNVPSIGTILKRMYVQIDRLTDAMDRYNEQLGTPANPGRTCADIMASKSQAQSGMFWIDPNMGSRKDAIRVDCRVQADKSVKTCIPPTNQMKPLMSYEKPSSEDKWWLSELPDPNGKVAKLFYAPYSQIVFLQMLHNRSEQTVSILCKQSAVYYDSSQKNFDNAINLRIFSDRVINSHKDRRIKSDADSTLLEIQVEDDCLDRNSIATDSKFQLVAKDPRYLPVTDIQLKDFGQPNQQLGYVFDAVCFS